MNRHHDLLLFDLDGTISDPLLGIGRSINFALTAFDFEERPLERLKEFIGPPLDHTFAVLTGSSSKELIIKMVEKYRERFGDVGFSENRLYPGVKEALFDLYTHGVSMAICTSKRADYAEKIVRLFGLDEMFQFVDGGDIGISKQRQMAGLLAADAMTRETLMIGDRAVDLVAAHANGLSSAGVLWGYGSRRELEDENPALLFSQPQEWQALKERMSR